MSANWTIVPPKNSPWARIVEMYASWSLFGFFVRTAWKWTYRRTSWGPLWMFVRPFMAVAVHLVFFGLVLNLNESDTPFEIFYLSGMMLWFSFDQGVFWVTRCLETNRKLITKIYFPRLILPLAYLAPAVVDFLVLGTITLIVTAGYFLTTGEWYLFLNANTLWVVPIIFMTMAFALGIGLWAAPIAAQSRDIIFTLRYILGAWFLLTPVAYPPGLFTGPMKLLPKLNPMAPIITSFREALTNVPVNGQSLIVPAILISILFLTGFFFFVANDAKMADRI